MEGLTDHHNKLISLVNSSKDEIGYIKNSTTKLDDLVDTIINYFVNLSTFHDNFVRSNRTRAKVKKNQKNNTVSIDDFEKCDECVRTLRKETAVIKSSIDELEKKHEDIYSTLTLDNQSFTASKNKVGTSAGIPSSAVKKEGIYDDLCETNNVESCDSGLLEINDIKYQNNSSIDNLVFNDIDQDAIGVSNVPEDEEDIVKDIKPDHQYSENDDETEDETNVTSLDDDNYSDGIFVEKNKSNLDDDKDDPDYVPEIEGQEQEDDAVFDSNYKFNTLPQEQGGEYECDQCKLRFSRLYNLEQHQLLSKGTGSCKQFKFNHENQSYICNACKKEFKYRHTLKRHLISHSGIVPRKCHLCNKGYSVNYRLIEHFRSAHRKAPLYKCKLCTNVYTQSEALEEHVKSHEKKPGPKGPFKCEECEQIFTSYKYYRNHLRHHKKSKDLKEYECPKCTRSFRIEKSLKNHLQNHEDQSVFVCEDCGKSCSTLSGLKNHMKTHQVKETDDATTIENTGDVAQAEVKIKPKFSCNKCSKVSTNVYKMNYHKKYCTGEKTEICERCGEKFYKSISLRKHMKKHDKSDFRCPDCKKCFLNDELLLNHRSKYHIVHKCDKCDKTYTKPESLVIHMTTHSDERPFKCQSCGRCFSHRQLYNNHMRNSHTYRFTCDECGRAFSKMDFLKRHIMTHTGERPHSCEVCGRCFITRFGVKTHMKTHTGEKPHHCEICLKKFTEAKSLKRHMLIHTGEKPYQCEYCDKCFNQNSSLQSHRRIHTGEKPFSCDFCDMSFNQKSSLNTHVTKHTASAPPPLSVDIN